jgi:hypothetical protein
MEVAKTMIDTSDLNRSKHYLQGTILGEIRSEEYIPSKENLKNGNLFK